MVKVRNFRKKKQILITYGDLKRLLEEQGFVFQIVKSNITINGKHSLFEHRKSGAKLRYPIFRVSDPVRSIHLGMARTTLEWRGIMPEQEFDEWARDPKGFEAA